MISPYLESPVFFQDLQEVHLLQMYYTTVLFAEREQKSLV